MTRMAALVGILLGLTAGVTLATASTDGGLNPYLAAQDAPFEEM